MNTFDILLKTLQQARITLPAIELTSLLLIMAVCLVLRYSRTGLLAAYLFTYRWGWGFFTDENEEYLLAYLIFGTIVGVLTAVDMIRSWSGK